MKKIPLLVVVEVPDCFEHEAEWTVDELLVLAQIGRPIVAIEKLTPRHEWMTQRKDTE